MNIHVCDGAIQVDGTAVKDHDKLTEADYIVTIAVAGEYVTMNKHVCREHFRTWLNMMSTGGAREGMSYTYALL